MPSPPSLPAAACARRLRPRPLPASSTRSRSTSDARRTPATLPIHPSSIGGGGNWKRWAAGGGRALMQASGVDETRPFSPPLMFPPLFPPSPLPAASTRLSSGSPSPTLSAPYCCCSPSSQLGQRQAEAAGSPISAHDGRTTVPGVCKFDRIRNRASCKPMCILYHRLLLHMRAETGPVTHMVYRGRSFKYSFLPKRRAASYGAKVALIEATEKLGGTCVNVGMSLASLASDPRSR